MGCDGKFSAHALPPNASIAINAAQTVLRIPPSNAAATFTPRTQFRAAITQFRAAITTVSRSDNYSFA
jgi:hypothetical protein